MVSSSRPEPRIAHHRLEPACAWAAFAVPFVVACLRAECSSGWRDDWALGHAFDGGGLGGGASSLVIALFSLLPLGGQTLRAALASALGLGVAAWLVQRLSFQLLTDNARPQPGPALTPVLALSAALSAALSLGFQLEATSAGGSTWAVAFALAGIAWRQGALPGDERVWLGCGGLLAAATLESRSAGLALLIALVAHGVTTGELPAKRQLLWLCASAVLVSLLCLGPALAHTLEGELTLPELARGLRDGFPSSLGSPRAALGEWLADLGLVPLALGGFAAIWGGWRARLRPLTSALVAVCLLHAALAQPAASPELADPGVTLHLLSTASLAVLGVVGLQSCLMLLARARLPFAGAARKGLVIYQFTLVLLIAEDSASSADRRQQLAADVWTDEAWSSLPARSALLVRSPTLAARLLATRALRGERPDVLVVSYAELERGTCAAELLTREPRLAALIKDLAIAGRPSEFALSSLADARPLFVDSAAEWEPRLVEHLEPHGQWLGFSPHPLGRSDRAQGVRRVLRSALRVLSAARRPEYPDRPTASVLGDRIAAHAVTLAHLHDRDASRELLDLLRTVAPSHPSIAAIERDLAAPKRALAVLGVH